MHLVEKNNDETLAAFAVLDRRFGKITHPRITDRTVDALFRKARILRQQGDFEAALAIYDDIEQRAGRPITGSGEYRDGLIGRTNHVIARVLLEKGRVLEQQGKTEAAIVLYDQIGQRFGYPHAWVPQDAVAEALKTRAAAKARLAGD
ncbi:MAG: tetratricopeptide repeat protein [Zoogloeaceae bacterium]|nr:tetratricopeptide repeat protein [Zoogloeaceae bacterium]